MQILSRQLADGIIDENEYMKFGSKIEYEYEYRNITSPVKGLYNIKNVIKDDLDYFMSLPYVLKVDVVQVVINKMDLEPKTYRYRGAIDKKEIVYDKARNANKNLFQYKAYNMDPNNETPRECVPNALFKMYGDKSKGSTYYKDWLALVDGYCYVGRQRSCTWIKLDSARSAVPGSTRSANASVAHVYILVILPSDGKRGGWGATGEPGLRARYRCRTLNAASLRTLSGQAGGGGL